MSDMLDIVVNLNKFTIGDSSHSIEDIGSALWDWVYDVTFKPDLLKLVNKCSYYFNKRFYRGDFIINGSLKVGDKLDSKEMYSFTSNESIGYSFMVDKFQNYVDDYIQDVVMVMFVVDGMNAVPITDIIVESLLYIEYMNEEEYKASDDLYVVSIEDKVHVDGSSTYNYKYIILETRTNPTANPAYATPITDLMREYNAEPMEISSICPLCGSTYLKITSENRKLDEIEFCMNLSCINTYKSSIKKF